MMKRTKSRLIMAILLVTLGAAELVQAQPMRFQGKSSKMGWTLPARSTMWAMRDGWDHGNAGDSFAAEFIMTAKDLVQHLKTLPSTELKGFKIETFIGAIETTTVRSEQVLYYEDGREVEGINKPEQKLILINRRMWRENRVETETLHRYTFVLHEYLWIMGIDDTQYKVSAPIVALLSVKNNDPSKWWNPLNPVNYLTLNLVYNSGACTIDGASFNLAKTEEMVMIETKGDCGDDYRKVVIAKSSLTAPPSSNARGTFHRFQVAVMDQAGNSLGQLTYEPEWGRCLGPQTGACASSGKVLVGGVEIIFWLRP
ncbi:hypothetical protein [Bdellovibrio sp. HCB209]|uniref:hypothetical protein n=1 Tax=Bdellovibrio sp. HCB209 TaxID=3394354 RepID=UPI0039B41DAA